MQTQPWRGRASDKRDAKVLRSRRKRRRLGQAASLLTYGSGKRLDSSAIDFAFFPAPTERTPSRESANNGHPVCGNYDRLRLGGLRSLAAVAARKSAPFPGADGADALQGIG